MNQSDGTSTGEKRPWWVVGCGRMGQTLGLLAGRLGVPVVGTWNRDAASAARAASAADNAVHRHGPLEEVAADIDWPPGVVVWITVVDDAIAEVAETLAGTLPYDAMVLHCCGSRGAGVLREAGVRATVGSVHPLLAITDPERAVEQLSDVTWSVEGDDEAVRWARSLLEELGAEVIQLAPGARPLYHASAVTSANLLVALMDAAFEMAEAAGVAPEQARRMLLALGRSSVENLEAQPPADALSGPAARGDRGTIERHIAAIEELEDPKLSAIYEALIERALDLGEDDGEGDDAGDDSG